MPQVTLTTANTAYRLSTLITSVDAAIIQRFQELVLQSDSTNGAAIIYVSRVDKTNLTSSRFGYKLLTGDSQTHRANGDSVSTLDFYVLSDTNNAKLNVDGGNR